MNKGIYRLIFNRARGLLMVVGELARRTSKTTTTTKRLSQTAASSLIATLRPLPLAFLFASGGVSLSPTLSADIVADPNAPGSQRAVVLSTANGLPQVNIQTPSSAGVSRNVYRQFDVDAQGAILNNSRTNTSTQLGGRVTGNPYLAGGSARVIVNEINSTNPSHLNGHIEVAGSRAEVVFANPAGISCAGCGFINAQKATLTTGEVLYENGDLTGYRVEQGTITISGEGLDTSNADYTQIIARSVEVNAGIWAEDLSITTGTNTVDRDNTQVTEHSPSQGQAPRYAIDVSALGGMYAGKIRLVGTEDGVGVRNAGTLGASVGDVVITADGRLENRHHISSATDTRLQAASIDNSGVVYSGHNTTLNASNTLNNRKTIAAANHTTLMAHSITQGAEGALGAGVNADGSLLVSTSLTNTGRLEITATDSIHLSGDQVAKGSLGASAQEIHLEQATQQAARIDLQAPQLSISNSTQQADSLDLTGQQDLDLSGSTLTIQEQLSLSTAEKLTTDQATIRAGALSITANNLSNQAGSLQQTGTDTTTITVTQTIDNTDGTIGSNGAFTIHAKQLINEGGNISNLGNTIVTLDSTLDALNPSLNNQSGSIASGGELTLTTGAIANDQGLIQSTQKLTLNTQGQALSNTNSGNDKGIISGHALDLTTGELHNNTGYLGANQAITLKSASITNTEGTILGLSSLDLSSTKLDNQQGSLQAGQDIEIRLNTIDTDPNSGTLDNREGLIRSNQALRVTAKTINNSNTDATITDDTTQAVTENLEGLQGATVALNAETVNNTNGRIISDHFSSAEIGTLENAGGIVSAVDTLTLTDGSQEKSQQLKNNNGLFIAGKTLTVDSLGLVGSGKVLSQGVFDVDLIGDYTHTNDFTANDNLSFTLTGTLTNQALLAAVNTLDIDAAVIDNSSTGELSATTTKLTATNTLTNRGLIDGDTTMLEAATLSNLSAGQIYGDTITIEASTLNNDGEDDKAPVIAARRELNIGVNTLENRDNALIYSDGNASIRGAITNGQATGQAGTITNASATIEALGTLDINAKRLDNLDTHFEIDENQSISSSETVVAYSIEEFNSTRYDASPTVFRFKADPNEDVAFVQTPSGSSDRFFQYNFTRTTHQPTVKNAKPGTIRSGENTTLTVDTINNSSSHIIAGGTLKHSGSTLNNITPTVTASISESGTFTEFFRIKQSGHDRQGARTYNYSGPSNLSRIVGPVSEIFVDDVTGQTETRTVQRRTDIIGDPTTTEVSLQTSVFQANTQATQGFTISKLTVDPVNQNAQGANNTDITGRSLTQVSEVTNDNGTIRSSNRIPTVSNNSLFAQNPSPTATFLVETDPRFTRNRQWLSSAYITEQLGQAPAITQKRLGDGFYEQRLVREQIGELTGRRFLANYSSDEVQYQALLDAGVTYAKQYKLQPGLALSATQMANITTPLVWLEAQAVKLADGSTQQVLVPKLYAVVQKNDLLPSGALLSADNLDLKGETLTNAGHLIARARIDIDGQRFSDIGGRLQATKASVNVDNDATFDASDWHTSDALDISAGRDVVVRSQSSTHRWSNEDGSGSRTDLSQASRLQVNGPSGELRINAGRNLSITAAEIDNQGTGDTRLTAGNNLTLTTLQTGQQHTYATGSDTLSNDIASQVHGGGQVSLQAGKALNIQGATINAEESLTLDAETIALTTAQKTLDVDYQGSQRTRRAESLTHQGVQLIAGSDLSLNALKDLEATGASATAGNNLALNAGGNTTIRAAQDEEYHYRKDHRKKSWGRSHTAIKESFTTTNVGGKLTAGNNLSINATINPNNSVTTQDSGSVTITGSDLTAENQLAISGDGVTLQDQKEIRFSREESHKSGFGGLSKHSTGSSQRIAHVQSSDITANTQDLDLLSADNITITGSNVIGGNDTRLQAAGDITIKAAEQTTAETSFDHKSKFGLISTGGFGVTIGEHSDKTDTRTDSTEQVSSTVGALNGDISITADDEVIIAASDILSRGGDIALSGNSVSLEARDNTLTHEEKREIKTSGITVALSGGVIDSINTAIASSKRANSTDNQALKALHTWKANNALDSLPEGFDNLSVENLGNDFADPLSATNPEGTKPEDQKGSSGINLAISAGSSRSESQSTLRQTTALGSSLSAGGDITINATGKKAGKHSGDIHSQGSHIAAETITLNAQDDVILASAENTSDSQQNHQSSSAALGISIGSDGLQFFAEGSRSEGFIAKEL